VVHGLAPPTKQQCSSSATHSEVSVCNSFSCFSFSTFRPASPPGSRHESLPSHDAPGVFLFDARRTNLYRCNLNRDLRPPHHLRNGSAFPPGRLLELRGVCPPDPRPQSPPIARGPFLEGLGQHLAGSPRRREGELSNAHCNPTDTFAPTPDIFPTVPHNLLQPPWELE
jgi:hypothetical protein